MKRASHVLVWSTAISLAGCNFAPPYERPASPPSASFKEAAPGGEANGQGWKLAEPRDAAIRGNWWEVYGDPELNALESRVAISNQTIIAAEATYRSAHALVQEAQAALFPTLTLDPSASRQKSSSGAAAVTTGGATYNDFTFPLEASYQIDLWGSIRNTVAENKFSAQASAATLANALLSTQSTLAQDYFELRVADEQRRILEKTVADYRSSLNLVHTLVANGVDSEADVITAEAQLASAEASATDVGVARAQYEHAIAVLIGVAPSEFSIPYKRLDQKLPIIPVGIPSDLLERRPDIATAERQVAEYNAQIGVARAAFFPTLSLTGAIGYESLALNQLFKASNRTWSAGTSLAQTVFDGGAHRAALAQAHALMESEAATYRATVLSALQSVEDNLATLRILSVEVTQAHNATLAAQRSVELIVALYRNGIDSYVNVITAQNTFLSDRETELGIQLRQLTASVTLINDLGGGWSTAQFGATEQMAQHPPDAGKLPTVPDTSRPAVPNPPPLPLGEIQPDDIIKQNDEAMRSR